MPAVDHETIIITRLWTILEARSAFTDVVKVGNRIKLVGDKPTPLKIQWSAAPNDFPEVTISVSGVSDTLFTLEESYAMRAGATFNTATSPVTCDLTFNAIIDIIHRDQNFVTARTLTSEIMTAIRAAGPSLGITDFRIQRVGPSTRSSRVVSGRFGSYGDASGTMRLATSINLPVLVRAKTSDLVA